MVVANQFCSFDASDTSAAYKKIIELWGAAGPEEWFATFLDETDLSIYALNFVEDKTLVWQFSKTLEIIALK